MKFSIAELLDDIGRFLEKLFKSDAVQDAIDPIKDEAVKLALDILVDAAAKTGNRLDDLLVSTVKAGLQLQKVDPAKLNQ